jgi:glycosyltransferase involved in cell wall biosynthesis
MTGVSGAENHLLELTSALESEGWVSDVVVLAPAPASLQTFAKRLAVSCERVDVLPMKGDFRPNLIVRLARLLRTGRYDVAHAHLVHADWYLAAASLLAPGTPLVSTKHNHDPFRRRRSFRLVDGLSHRRYAAVISISESLCDFTRTFGSVRTTAIHYGLPAEAMPPRHENRAGVSFLGVGRLERQKGFDVAVEAMPRVLEAIPDAHLSICGEGSERRRLEETIHAHGLEDAVSLLGQRADVDALMLDTDILVHPARWEGFGLVLLEAMRAGLPIVATQVGAIPEIVVDENTGLLIAPDDPKRLAAALIELGLDAEQRGKLGAAGFRRLQVQFSPQKMARATAAVYESVVASDSARRTSALV